MGRMFRLPWFKSHRALHEVNGIVRNAFEQLFWEGQIAFCDVEECLLLVVAAEGTEAGQQHIGQHAHAPNIGFQRERIVLDDLGGDVVGRALNLADALAAFDRSCESKIAQFQSIWGRREITVPDRELARCKITFEVARVEQDVLRFDIEMRHVSPVQIIEGLENFFDASSRRLLGNGRLCVKYRL